MTPQYRAVRFLDAGFASSQPGGLTTTATGGLAMVDGDESVRQALLTLLSTVPGERLMRPRYGSYLHRLLFAPNDATTAGLAIHYVRQAVERWEPRVDIVDVDADPDPHLPERLLVRLDYRVRATLTPGALVYPLDLDG